MNNPAQGPKRRAAGAVLLLLILAFAQPNGTGAIATGPTTRKDIMKDGEQILEHIHSLFRAYLAKDREAIRRGHTADWRGFQLPSPRIVRGIDQYMETADRILATMTGTRYEIRDSEVQVRGDIAIVYYTADYWVRDGAGEKRVPLRSVDVYRREPGGWNQCGSNICVIPAEREADAPAGEEVRR